MRFITQRGKLVNRSFKRHLINWDSKEKSQFQTNVKNFLYPYLKNHLVFSEMPVPGTRLRIDIFDGTTKTAFEIQGKQHEEYVEFFFKNRAGYINSIKRDVQKEKFCQLNNIKLVEIYESDMPLNYDLFVTKFDLHL